MPTLWPNSSLDRVRGILLAGGAGSRLRPMTVTVNKQLMAIYDKPMVYYPFSTLLLAGVTEILIVSAARDYPLFQQMFQDGSHLGVHVSYVIQERPEGIGQAISLGKDHIGQEPVAVILGDNIFYGPGLGSQLGKYFSYSQATIFAYQVASPQQYGVISFDSAGKPCEIIEKPLFPSSYFAVPGLYFYPPDVIEVAAKLFKSERGEYEITDINRYYLHQNRLQVQILPRGTAWLDTGTPDALLDAANYIRTIERCQGLKIGVPEEVAWRKGYIDDCQLEILAQTHTGSPYGTYLSQLLESDRNNCYED